MDNLNIEKNFVADLILKLFHPFVILVTLLLPHGGAGFSDAFKTVSKSFNQSTDVIGSGWDWLRHCIKIVVNQQVWVSAVHKIIWRFKRRGVDGRTISKTDC